MASAKTILVVDDDPDCREAARIILESNGYCVSTASNGDEGVEKARTEAPDLIILDAMMHTKLEGFRASVELRKGEATAGIPIIMVSGVYKDIPDLPSPKDCGLPVDAFLSKPVNPEQLLSCVRQHLKL